MVSVCDATATTVRGRHDIARLDGLEPDQVADHLAFLGLEDAFLGSEFRHRQQVRPGQYRGRRVGLQAGG